MGLTQSQAVSTTSTLTGPVVPQLTINIVARHMVNILMHIPDLWSLRHWLEFTGKGEYVENIHLINFGKTPKYIRSVDTYQITAL